MLERSFAGSRRAMLRFVGGVLGAGWCARSALLGAPAAAPAVDYRVPKRSYVAVTRGKRNIMVEKSLRTDARKVADQAMDRLEVNIGKALDVLPQHARPGLERLRFYLMHGPNAPEGGRDNGLDYIQKNAPASHHELDVRWGDSVVVYCAQNYLDQSDFWALKAIVHELAHAYHLHHWPEKQPDIVRAYRSAMARGLHHGVVDDKGKTLDASYAATNQLEYFAELSCMYFVGCNYAPFDRDDLKRYDPTGFAMIETLWKPDEDARARAKKEKKSRAS
jgi:hypothetical protein